MGEGVQTAGKALEGALGQHLFGRLEAHHLAPGVHAGIRAAGTDRLNGTGEHGGKGLLQLALHGELAGLPGKPGKSRPLVCHAR